MWSYGNFRRQLQEFTDISPGYIGHAFNFFFEPEVSGVIEV